MFIEKLNLEESEITVFENSKTKTVKLKKRKFGYKFNFMKEKYLFIQHNSDNIIIKINDRIKDIYKIYTKKLNQTWREYENKLKEIINHYKDCETEKDSIPSGPDTSKFRATRYGFIEYMEHYNYRDGYCGFSRYIHKGVKIGSNVNCPELYDEIKLLSLLLSKKLNYNNSDSVPTYKYKYGSAYSVIGIG